MRVVSWNLNRATWNSRRRCATGDEHARRAWTEIAELGADVALVQEAPPPPPDLERPATGTIPAGVEPEDWRSLPGPRRWWSTAIASWDLPVAPIEDEARHPLAVTHKGAYAAGFVPWRGGRLIVVSVYALWDYDWIHKDGGKPVYSETSLHRTLSDLTPILDVHRNGLSVVIGGDLNASTQFGEPARSAYRVVHDRLSSLGLQNISVRPADDVLDGCPCVDDPCRHIRSLEGTRPFQDDYIYASADVAATARLMPVERTEGMEFVSDHFPVVIETD